MFWFIKQVFIVLLSFGESLSIKCMSLNNEPYMATLTHQIFETNSSFHVN